VDDNIATRKGGLTRFDWLVLILSVYVIIELYLDLIMDYSPGVRSIAEFVDLGICVVFLADFFWRLWKADARLTFLKWNWLDFISSIPMVGVLRIARAARIVRLLRLFRSGKVFYSLLSKNQSASTFQTVAGLCVVAILLGALAMFRLEQDVSPFFQSFGNSLWWSLLTTTTLGFAQDIHPLTPEGKAVSMFLIGAGIILVGTFTGMVADYFIADEEIVKRLGKVEQRLERIEKKLDQIVNKLTDR